MFDDVTLELAKGRELIILSKDDKVRSRNLKQLKPGDKITFSGERTL